MTLEWQVVIGVSAATILVKAAGPMILAGGSARDGRMSSLSRYAPVIFAGVLAALITTQVFARGQQIVLDERVGGLIVAMIGAQRRGSPVLVLLAAMVVTAILRLVISSWEVP